MEVIAYSFLVVTGAFLSEKIEERWQYLFGYFMGFIGAMILFSGKIFK